MLDTARVSEIAGEVARKWVAEAGLERVFCEPAADSAGNEALRVTLVLKPEAAQRLTGDEALDLLSGLQDKLQAEGEERFAIVQYRRGGGLIRPRAFAAVGDPGYPAHPSEETEL